MPRPRNQAARRAELVAAAAQAVLERGASQARLRDVAQGAGLTPAAVLYYYADLNELFAAVLAEGIAAYCEGRERVIDRHVSAADRMRACIHSGVPWPGEMADASRLLFELTDVVFHNEDAATANAQFVARQTTLYQRIIEQGVDSGEFELQAHSTDIARSFVALEDGYALDVLLGRLVAADVERRLLVHARLTLNAPTFVDPEISVDPEAPARRR